VIPAREAQKAALTSRFVSDSNNTVPCHHKVCLSVFVAFFQQVSSSESIPRYQLHARSASDQQEVLLESSKHTRLHVQAEASSPNRTDLAARTADHVRALNLPLPQQQQIAIPQAAINYRSRLTSTTATRFIIFLNANAWHSLRERVERWKNLPRQR